ncbi:hypothetical protein CKO31_18290 [Thiohalocapsa halophila]|uniref:Uncharacterized protein n=1 Tax=Thiohalocapsa halophila TaxID=69359 RepID=A0ABS1CL50_9GAMM|nr:hypothetical protein [Thiohalocapsa halophila]MBK1632656.1 hypothetical protein [Thiohalocapsa halophila]
MTNVMRLLTLAAVVLLLPLILILILRSTDDCADPSVSLDATQKPGGLVALDGRVANVGTLDYTADADIVVTMNVRYPPMTYNQIGISEDICRKKLGTLGAGEELKFKCNYTIPDFGSWTNGGAPDALRLFTAWIQKSDYAFHTPGEDCDADDSRAWVEVGYLSAPGE